MEKNYLMKDIRDMSIRIDDPENTPHKIHKIGTKYYFQILILFKKIYYVEIDFENKTSKPIKRLPNDCNDNITLEDIDNIEKVLERVPSLNEPRKDFCSLKEKKIVYDIFRYERKLTYLKYLIKQNKNKGK